MQINIKDLITIHRSQTPFSATDSIMSAHRMTSKTRDSVVQTIEARVQRRLHEQAERRGLAILGQTDFRWAQYTENPLGALLDEEGSTRYTEYPWTPGEPMLDGFAHLMVQVHGVAVEKIKLGWPE